jgi:hypothetical protein
MCDWQLGIDAFVSWLCEHEGRFVGIPGRYFESPLARWLEETYGRVYGVNEYCCWLASDEQRLFRLPAWARLFVVQSERMAYRAVTGSEAFMMLACIEERLSRGTHV